MANNTLQNAFEDFNIPQLDRQRADSDYRHVFVSSVVWKPNYFSGSNRFVRGTLNGWTISSIITLQSGAPFNVTTGADTERRRQQQRSPQRCARQDPPAYSTTAALA